jgi:glutamate synthase (NADPH/NADH) large chain/glutamate synthase (ferredoxin)
VAKAHAGHRLISGHDGGTGASPLSSIKHAGTPWELGVAETQQVLVLNNLRNRIVLRTDGGMRTGEDIVKAAILGAEEFNFGTAALIALGCVYVRQCHLNTCPVGVATQDEKLRAKFVGTPERVVNFFNGVAEEVRQIMAPLGVRTLTDSSAARVPQAARRPGSSEGQHARPQPAARRSCARTIRRAALLHPRAQRRLHGRPLDDIILQDAKDAITDAVPMTLKYKVKNTNRSVGTKVSGEIGYTYRGDYLPEGTLTLGTRGQRGQSFGAFLAKA